MPYQHLLVDRDGGVLTIRINRPHVMNALNAATIDELGWAMTEVDLDRTIGAVVLTGVGGRAFAAGADIQELAEESPEGAHTRARRAHEVFSRIERSGAPVIAAVNGVALGGGCELAMACAVRVAASHARFGQPELNLGLIPGFGATERLPRLVGRGRALEMLLRAEPIDASEAWRIGLVNRVVPAADLAASTADLASAVAEKPRLAVRSLIEAVTAGSDVSVGDAGGEREAALFARLFATADMREGTRAFLEKRKPAFEGR